MFSFCLRFMIFVSFLHVFLCFLGFVQFGKTYFTIGYELLNISCIGLFVVLCMSSSFLGFKD